MRDALLHVLYAYVSSPLKKKSPMEVKETNVSSLYLRQQQQQLVTNG